LSLSSTGLPEDVSGGEAILPWSLAVARGGQRWGLLWEVPAASSGEMRSLHGRALAGLVETWDGQVH